MVCKTLDARGWYFLEQNIYFILDSKCNQDKIIYMFQYKILHKILAKNVKLKQFYTKQYDTCDYFGLAPESYDCDI